MAKIIVSFTVDKSSWTTIVVITAWECVVEADY